MITVLNWSSCKIRAETIPPKCRCGSGFRVNLNLKPKPELEFVQNPSGNYPSQMQVLGFRV